ncbi:MAG: hypothetical protein ACYC3L_16320, partial [Gemmatimonadaceae bacterium]
RAAPLWRPGGRMPASYKWRENNACVATYKVLEGDNFLDQFEDADLPFDKAGAVQLKTLRYFPKTTTNGDLIVILADGIARKFLAYVAKVYTVRKQKATSSARIINAVAAVLADGSKTIADLAAVVDDCIKFPDEA